MRSSRRRLLVPTSLLATASFAALAFGPLADTPVAVAQAGDVTLVGEAVAPSAAALAIPAGYTAEEFWYPAHDGVMLKAAVYLPADRTADERHPMILSVTPYTSPNGGALGLGFFDGDIPVRFPELFTHPSFLAGRYGFIAADVRGFGGSGGCFSYYSQDEFLDMKDHVEWAATQPFSDGGVGLWGKSYDAAQEVLALGHDGDYEDVRALATVIQAPGLSGYTGLWHNGVHYATGRYATTSVYVADDLFPGQNRGTLDDPGYATAQVDGLETRPGCAVDWQAMNVIGDREDPYWDTHERYRDALGSSIPTLWNVGFHDANTKPVGLDVMTSLTGANHMWLGQWTHVRGHEPEVGRDGFLDESFRFLDEHVRGVVGATDVDATVTVQSGGPAGTWRTEAQWPPVDVATWSMPLNVGSYVDLPSDVTGDVADGAGIVSATPVLPHDLHLAGEMVLDADVTSVVPGAHLVARVYDVDASGRGYLVQRTAQALRGGAETLEVAFYPNDYLVPAGNRLVVHVAASDDAWYAPGATGQTVAVSRADLDLPLLTVARGASTQVDGGPSNASTPFRVTIPTADLAAAEVVGAVPPAMR